jgi:CheY-like chemotaxis protein
MRSLHLGQRGWLIGGIVDFDMAELVGTDIQFPTRQDRSRRKYRQSPGTNVHFVTYGERPSPRGERLALNEKIPVVLVIEDDEPIQVVVEDALAEAGFAPAIVASGEEAVTLLQGMAQEYRALVTDIALRGRINGWEVAQRAREIDPNFPVVYMSGASAGEWASKGVPNSVMLEKPFAPAQLIAAIANLLNSGTPTP